jgi:hypothetical protein
MSPEVDHQEAIQGMAQAIYDAMRATIEADLDLEGLSEGDLQAMRTGWEKLSHAIATGVITYSIENMEIVGIEAKGEVDSLVVETKQTDDVLGHVGFQ